MRTLLYRNFTVSVRKAFFLCLLSTFSVGAFAQTIPVNGTVSAASDNEPLPGVTIFVQGTTNGTSSRVDGTYTLNASMGDTIVFSFIGFTTQKRAVTGSTLNVALSDDAQQLGEVAVIGYGTTSIENSTGAITNVSEADFNRGNIVTPENLLNGRVAGLNINTGGAPGSGSTIRIRGGSSLGASNDPLIVINGLPIDNNTIGGSRSVLSTINPNDIESFTVLKDAAATAIYGSRAANGVIIITTKSASRKFQVSLDVQTGINTLVNTVDVLSADEFRQVVEEQRPDLLPLLGDANTNWQDEIYQNGLSNNMNLSVQGNLFNKLPAKLTLGRSNQEGLRLTSEYERNTATVNLNPTFFDDHLRVTVNANGSQEKNRFAAGEEGNAITFDPTQPVYDAESPFGGFFQYYDINDDDVLNVNDLTPDAPLNPVANLLQANNTSEVYRIYGNMQFEYNLHFFPDLKAVVNLGYDEQSAEGETNTDMENPITQPNGEFLGSATTYSNYQRNRLFDGYLTYNKTINSLDLEATGGYSFQEFTSNQYISGELMNDQPDSEPVYTAQTDRVLIGFFGRTNLTLNDKYLLTLSYRRDGTSRFSEENRWGNFPAAAVAWKIREDLFPDFKTVSNLKLRLGWGITGQQDIGRDNADLFLQRYARGLPASQYQFGGQVIPIAIPVFRNENLKWEETTTYNAGVDYGLLENRLTGSVEVFYKESRDLLANAAISDGSNFSNSGFQNIGVFTSKGIEFSMNADILTKKDAFNWNVNFNTTFLSREIKELALDEDQQVGETGGGTGNTAQIHRVGFQPFSYFVYKQVYDEAGNPIEGAYADLNGDNQINSDDRYIFQNNTPDMTIGFLSNMYYKNFDLSFNLRASVGNYVYNNVASANAQYDLLQNNAVVSNLPTSVRETGFNTTADVILSDYYIENASFLRMDNVTLGYNFDKLWDKADLRLSLGVQNVFVITNYTGLDPEVFENGLDNTMYPRARTYFIGANVRF